MYGCMTPKKADRQLSKIMDEYPDKVSIVCQDEFPCKPLKADTIEKVYYDLIEVECPEVTKVIKSTDTIIKKVHVKIPSKERIIIKYIEDSAKIYQLSQALTDCKGKLDTCLNKKVVIEKKSSNRLSWILILIIVSLLAYIVRRR